MKKPKYQLFGTLSDEVLSVLRKDIKDNGVRTAVDIDTDGNILDGHHRAAIAEEFGIDYETVVHPYKTEAEKRQHVIAVNLMRRHLAPHEWGGIFKRLLEEKGVDRRGGQGKGGGEPSHIDFVDSAKSISVTSLADELGVHEATARTRMNQHDKYEALSKKKRLAVDSGTTTLPQALKVVGVRSAGQRPTPRQSRKGKVIKLTKECLKIANTRIMELNIIKLRNKLEQLLQLVVT